MDGCRVDASDGRPLIESKAEASSHAFGNGLNGSRCAGTTTQGRWPANLIHDGSAEVVALFPNSAGAGGSVPNVKVTGYGSGIGTGSSDYLGGERTKVDSGSGSAARFFKQCSLEDEDIEAARLFYCAKVAKSERNRGLPEGMVNNHPTLKPVSLCSYLIRLITPPGGTVLDPFMGSGSMGVAAMQERVDYIGCELGAEYLAIAAERIRHAHAAANPEPSEAAEVEPEPQMSLFA